MKHILIVVMLVFFAVDTFGQISTVNTVDVITNEKVVLTLKCYIGSIQWQSSNNQTTWVDSTNCIADTLQIIAKSSRYYRAKITYRNCPPYYSDITFIKLNNKVPTLTTNNVTNITISSATTGGNITSDGGETVTTRGVCWNTTGNPTTTDSITLDSSGIGSFVSSITGLTSGTIYYVRAYATNAIGTAYGADSSFTTLPTLPTITTNAITDITATTAASGGNITSDGGAIVIARGVCFSIGQTPTLADSVTIDGTGTGNFTSVITDLTPNTNYYVRAYATNSIGTRYGDVLTFTSLGVETLIGCEQAYPNICGDTVTTYLDGELITCLIINGKYIYQGDIIIGSQTKGAAIASKVKRWPDNVVYYTINSNFRHKERITYAIEEYEYKTSLTFKERTNQTNYVEFVYDTKGCWSELGMQDEKQEIGISDNAVIGNVIHEIGHAIGIEHEHCKAGRDNYVIVIEENIIEEYKINFIECKNSINTPGFDFNSIMLYPSLAFSKNNKPTITKKDSTKFESQRDSLSASDIEIINIIYPKFYVSTTGDDKNSGSKILPFKTIQVAIDKVANFSTTTDTAIIYVEQGDYLPGNGLNNNGSGVVINNSNIKLLGGWDSKFENQVGYSILDGQGIVNSVILEVINANNVTIERLDIKNSNNGGVSFNSAYNCWFQNSIVENNYINNSGGGININHSNHITIFNTTVTKNQCTIEGAGINLFASDSNKIINSTVTENTGNSQGGGICLNGSSYNEISGGTIFSNQHCCGLRIDGGNFNIINTTIKDNTCDAFGGGVYISGGEYNEINCTIEGNYSAQNGGGICLDGWGGSITQNNIVSGTIINNSAGVGGGVNLEAGANYNLINATISGNNSSAGGGVRIYNADYNTISGIITGNVSSNKGGGVWLFQNTNNIINGEVSGNSPDDVYLR